MSGERKRLLREAVRLEYLTLVWMTVEFAASVALGLLSGSLLLLAFGIDSLIELASAVVLLLRFRWELRGDAGPENIERVERLTARVAGGLLFALAAYILAYSVYGLVAGHRADADTSVWGLAIAVVAVIGMPILAHTKRRLAASDRLNSPALRADSDEALSCAYLSAVLLVGLALSAAFGWWWLDSAAALALIPFLVVEGREAFEAETADD